MVAEKSTGSRETNPAAQETRLATLSQPAPGWALSISEMAARVTAVEQLYREVMKPGIDYDTLPGTQHPTLLQPGAQLLDLVAGYVPTFEVLPSSIVDFQVGFFHYEVRCKLVSKATGEVVAEGLGSCNSREDRYRWREARRVCPTCGAAAISKSREEYGGGWYCNRRANGCGARYDRDDDRIVRQRHGRIENDEPYTLANTLLKMAQKRSHIAATLNATGASRIFSQDLEDMVPPDDSAPPVSTTAGTRPGNAAPKTEPAAPKPANAGSGGARSSNQGRAGAEIHCKECNGIIEARVIDGKTWSPAKLAEYSRVNCGVALCPECAKPIKDAALPDDSPLWEQADRVAEDAKELNVSLPKLWKWTTRAEVEKWIDDGIQLVEQARALAEQMQAGAGSVPEGKLL